MAADHRVAALARPGTPERVQLSREGRAASLSVENQGPPLPAQMKGRLFESMVSIRPAGGEGEPHLGLGLYIVRLIAAFHGGEARARDRDRGDGVIVGVSIPLRTGGLGTGTLPTPGRAESTP